MKTIAIIGRPNVGKSTLFNALIGKKKAIVHDTPGVTRDRKTATFKTQNGTVLLTDTAGLERAENKELQKLMMEQTQGAIADADILLFVTDGATGITAQDEYFAKEIRKQKKPVILLVNKCEKKLSSTEEFYRLGFGEPVAISAEHKLGLNDLYEQLATHLTDNEGEEEPTNAIQIAIVGRPNVGKSTIINNLLKQNRVIVSPTAGTTRDSIYINWEYGGQNIKLVDTAGLRKRANIFETLEKFSVGDTLEALKFAHVAVLVMDATECFEHQDLKILDLIIREGRALIMVMNKWDKVGNKTEVTEEIEYLLGKYTGKISGVTVLKTSAEKDKNLDAILQRALEAYEVWNKKIPTSALNRWLSHILQRHSPPIAKGRRIKIRYITQIKTRPPTFMLDVSLPDALPDSYMTYITKDLRESFGMPGTPLRIQTPKKSNPFENKKS